MPRTKFIPPEPRPERRDKWRRFRVTQEEGRRVDELANQAGFDTASDYLRSLVGLPGLLRGAPKGNQNKTGKAGANQFAKKVSRKVKR